MVQDDDFELRLGKIRSLGGRRGRKYLHRVLRATNLAKGGSGVSRKSRFSGSRIGRGAGIGRVLAARDRYAAYRRRRVVIKSRIVKLAGKGLQGARAHLRYIQRDGVTRDGRPGQLYDAAHDQADGRTFLDRAGGDRHQFRFIVSAEDGAQYEDLKPLVRRLMARMEEDLGTRLDWVAVDHYNTGHPHSHVILRGRDDRGRDLIIARDYITTGMRERAAEIVGLDFGSRSDFEIEDRLRQEVEQERLTSLDRALLRDVGPNGLVSATDADAFRQSLRAGRLRKLERLGLAEEIRPGQWQLAEGLEDTLRRMGERGDIIKTMHRAMTERGMARAATECVIDDPAQARSIVGRVVARGLSDEINDRHYLIIDGIDGYSHYVDIGAGQSVEPLPEGAILRVESRRIEPRQTDRTVAEIAAAHDGRYSVDIHLRHDPTASQDFAETHVRRLEVLRKLTGAVTREPDGTWTIALDHLERAAEYERRQAKDRPVKVTALSPLSLERQVTADGATWLDRELLSATPESLRDAGFGREVRDALARRRHWLIAENLAHKDHERVVFRADLLDTLRRRELARVAGQLSGELGLAYVEAGKGERINGIYRRALDLASGRYALIEKSREFTLVPWRPVLDRHLGRQVSGIMCGDGISWAIGRQRGGPGVG